MSPPLVKERFVTLDALARAYERERRPALADDIRSAVRDHAKASDRRTAVFDCHGIPPPRDLQREAVKNAPPPSIERPLHESFPAVTQQDADKYD